MSKIYAKVMFEQKIKKEYTYNLKEPFNIHHLPIYLIDICEALDISVPIIITKHVKHYYLFNTTRFDISDFIGESDFDYLILENGN